MGNVIFYKGKKFTSGNTEYKVEQIGGVDTNANYEILLSGSADDTTHIEGTKKTSTLHYNPYTKSLLVKNGSLTVGSFDIADYGGITINKTDITLSSGWIGNETSLKTALGSLDPSGKVSKIGDTMTGALNMNNVNVVVKDTDIDTNTDPSSAVWGKGYYLTCTNDVSIGYLRAIKATDGKQGVQMETERYINGTRYFHNLNLRIGNDGTKYVEMSDPDAWRATLNLNVPRVVKSCNSIPGKNRIVFEEYTAGASYNLPSNAWYHIYTSEGSDQAYACQLALGMTTDGVYYRRYSNSSWGSWQALTNDGYLPLSGGYMNGSIFMNGFSTAYKGDGGIVYQGTKATSNAIGFIDNTSDTAGNGIVIGGGGQTIIGGGESYSAMKGQAGSDGREIMWVGNDSDVVIYTNLQNGWASRKTFTFNSSGNLVIGNTTIYQGTNGGLNSVIFGDDVTLGDCNVSGMLGMKSTGANCGIRLYSSSGSLIGGFQSTNGTPQWINSSGTATTISLNGHTHAYLATSGNGSLSGTITNAGYFKQKVQGLTGICASGRNDGHTYQLNWNSSSKLEFWVDTTNIGTLSDRRLKHEIEEVTSDTQLLNIIDNCKIYTYKADNRNGQISMGIMAQDFMSECKKLNLKPEDYEVFGIMQYTNTDDTEYYTIEYDQYAVIKCAALERRINELENKIEELERRN